MAAIITSLCIGVIGFVLLIAAGWIFYNQRNKTMAGLTTTGTVIDLTRESTANVGSPGIYCPVVEFSLPSGETITFTSNYGTRPASHKVGQSVNVRYDPDDPQKAVIDSVFAIWLVPGIMLIMGVVFCCLGAFLLPFFWMMNSF